MGPNRRKACCFKPTAERCFIEEVADIPPAVQLKLLRVMDQGELLPLGAETPLRSRFRVISATQHDLRRKVESGRAASRSVLSPVHV